MAIIKNFFITKGFMKTNQEKMQVIELGKVTEITRGNGFFRSESYVT